MTPRAPAGIFIAISDPNASSPLDYRGKMPSLQNVTHRKLEPPLRGEPFSAEHLWNYAEQFAASQVVSRRGADRRLVDRFESNSRFIADAYRAISQSIRDGEPLAPDAEWLVDNYYVVEEQLREIREDLPRSYYLELPKLASGPFAGFPRVYELAHELVVHGDSSLDEELISGFIAAYQRVVPLTSGELWAVPIMLRVVLVENLRRLCATCWPPANAATMRNKFSIAGRAAITLFRSATSTTTAPCSSRS